jgi:hypothetical protein
VVRITDRQGYQASERWTDTLQDQAQLEALIDTVKLPAPVGQHRLLTTPFRYPPLRSGSRFTAADQRELFDGARGLATVSGGDRGRAGPAAAGTCRWKHWPWPATSIIPSTTASI